MANETDKKEFDMEKFIEAVNRGAGLPKPLTTLPTKPPVENTFEDAVSRGVEYARRAAGLPAKPGTE